VRRRFASGALPEAGALLTALVIGVAEQKSLLTNEICFYASDNTTDPQYPR
jgi:multisubunit Na+/H+ antiporter MnhC subunit